MLNFYSCSIIITELLMVAMILHVALYDGFKRVQKAWYLLTFIAIMVCAACEFAVHCGYYNPSFKVILAILTVIQFSIAPILSILFSGALGLNHQKKIALFVLGGSFLIEAVFAPFKLIFFFDNEGYHRGDLFIIYTILFVVSLGYLVVNMVIVGKRFRHRDVFTIGMIIIILISGIIPMVFHVNITYIAIAIASCVCYIYYNDLVQQDIQMALVKNQEIISKMQEHIISGMANLIENRDMDTGEHISRTSAYVKKIAENAQKEGVYADKLDPHFIALMSTLAPMHDIGKIIVPDRILKKPGRLTPEERTQMEKHASVGGEVVKEVLSGITNEEYINVASDIATYHHERWDGTGYPKGLKGEEIPLSARIMALADVFDALVSERCYKEAMTPSEAFKVIEEEAGTHFDPMLAQVFLNHRDDFLKK